MDKSKPLETVLVLVLALIAGYLTWHSKWWLVAALLIGISALLIPAMPSLLHRFWTMLSRLTGAVSGKILLSLVYILLLVPLAALARLMGKSGLRIKAGGTSYFVKRDHSYEKEDLLHPW